MEIEKMFQALEFYCDFALLRLLENLRKLVYVSPCSAVRPVLRQLRPYNVNPSLCSSLPHVDEYRRR